MKSFVMILPDENMTWLEECPRIQPLAMQSLVRVAKLKTLITIRSLVHSKDSHLVCSPSIHSLPHLDNALTERVHLHLEVICSLWIVHFILLLPFPLFTKHWTTFSTMYLLLIVFHLEHNFHLLFFKTRLQQTLKIPEYHSIHPLSLPPPIHPGAPMGNGSLNLNRKLL